MSYTEHDAAWDRYQDELEWERHQEQLRRSIEEGLKGQARDAAKTYLARHGDAVDKRVLASLAESKVLLNAGYFGPSLCASAIAVELMIRFMLVRPTIQGAFLSDEWAGILTAWIATGRTARDRELVPSVLRQWGLDVAEVRGAVSKAPVWEFIKSKLFPRRNDYMHQYEPISRDIAATALECAEAFRYEIVDMVANHLGFTLDVTGQWCKIIYPVVVDERSGTTSPSSEEFEPADPF
jgi:hypothetical protein